MEIKFNIKSIILVIFLLMILCSNTVIGLKTQTTILLACIVLFLYCRFNIKNFDSNGITVVILYSIWLIYLFFNILLSCDKSISFEFIYIFIGSFLLIFADWRDNNLLAFFRIGRIVCCFFAVTILLSLIFPEAILAISKFTNPGRTEVISLEIAEGKYSGLVGEKALAAYCMVFGVNIEIASYYLQNKKFTKLNIFLIFLYFICTLLSSKRMLTVILLVEIVLALSHFQIKNKGVRIILGVFVVAVVLLVVSLFIPQLRNIVVRYIEGGEDETYNGRLQFWNFCIQMFKEKPLVGYGVGTFNLVFGEKVGYIYQGELWNMHAHNMYLQILGECGAIGFIIFVTILIYCLVKSFRLFMNNKLTGFWNGVLWFSIGTQILFILYGITGNCFYDVSQIFSYLLSISFYLAANKLNKKNSLIITSQFEELQCSKGTINVY